MGMCFLEIWAIRCSHESQEHINSQFVTLTYNEKNLPKDGSIHPDQLQKFYKRLRKSLKTKKIRHFSCGEYGEICKICNKSPNSKNTGYRCNCTKPQIGLGRPHYHAIIFGLELEDKVYFDNDNGNNTYTSNYLEKIWNNGNVIIGDVTFESSAYVARYITKKINGDNAKEHYQGKHPEFIRMSNRPGIATSWYNKYKSDIYKPGTDGKAIIRGGIETTPPRFYENKYDNENPEHLKQIKIRRKIEAEKNAENTTISRLKTREIIHKRSISKLTRI